MNHEFRSRNAMQETWHSVKTKNKTEMNFFPLQIFPTYYFKITVNAAWISVAQMTSQTLFLAKGRPLRLLAFATARTSMCYESVAGEATRAPGFRSGTGQGEGSGGRGSPE